jgi:hypothetical protein
MTTQLISSIDAPATGTSTHIGAGIPHRTYSASVTGTGALTATVVIYGSNDGMTWNDLGTITLSGTSNATDGFPSVAPWEWVRADLTALSGTGAIVNVMMGK